MGWNLRMGYASARSIVLCIDSCGEKNNLCMLYHSHYGGFCMEPCRRCGEKCTSHTETDAEKQCSSATELVSFAILWLPQNRFTHIKTKKTQTDLLIREQLAILSGFDPLTCYPEAVKTKKMVLRCFVEVVKRIS